MTRISETIKSRYLKVEDLPGREQGWLDLTIRSARMGRFDDGRETVDLEFHETPKVLGCNATNRKRLMLIFGNEVELEQLPGCRVRLYAELTQDAKGVPCWGIRLKPVPDTVAAASAEARAKIEATRARMAAAEAAGRPRKPEPTMPRPMSHDPGRGQEAAPWPVEPAGFVDDQDPGFDERAGF